jgi:hypothetical protein
MTSLDGKKESTSAFFKPSSVVTKIIHYYTLSLPLSLSPSPPLSLSPSLSLSFVCSGSLNVINKFPDGGIEQVHSVEFSDSGKIEPKYTKVNLELLIMFNPPKKLICVKKILPFNCCFFLTQPTNTQITSYDFEKQNRVLPVNLHFELSILEITKCLLWKDLGVNTEKKQKRKSTPKFTKTKLHEAHFMELAVHLCSRWKWELEPMVLEVHVTRDIFAHNITMKR